jgi:hypothetical protein
VELIQVDALDAQPAQRRVALAADRVGGEEPSWLAHALGVVPDEAALRKDVRPLCGRDLAQQPSHDFLGMAEPVDRRRVYPVHSQFQRMPQRRQ